jgi:hypothetical protein
MKGLRAEPARNAKFANIVCSSGDLFWSLFVKKYFIDLQQILEFYELYEIAILQDQQTQLE